MFRRKKSRQAKRVSSEADSYSTAMTDRLRDLSDNSGPDYSEEEATEVEARIRRMFYGAKREDDFSV